MTRRFNTLSAVCLLLAMTPGLVEAQTSTTVQPQENEAGQTAKRTYEELRERVKKGDKTVDFVALISASSDLDLSRTGIFTAPGRDDMVAAFKAKDYKRATELAETVLDYEFTNRSLHRATENAYREQKHKERADFHRYVADEILKALLSTGDGKTAQTAYCVQGINEEYLIMRHFGYEVSSQALVLANDSSYDALSGIDKKTKKSIDLYFDISGHFSRCVKRRVTN